MAQSNTIKVRQSLELQAKLKEEQEQILHARSILEAEKRRKQEIREKLHKDDLDMLNFKSLTEKTKKMEAQQELLTDIELMRKKKEYEEKKERDYKEYFENIKKRQNLKQKLYSQQVGLKIEDKNSEINN